MRGPAGSVGRAPSGDRPDKHPVAEHLGRDNGLPRGYLRACLLLLVAEEPVHGYELLGQLSGLGLPKPDAGAVYRTLRSLDEEGLVDSWWTSSVAGPARRLYRITSAGRRCLECLTAGLEQNHGHLSCFIDRTRSLATPHHHPGPAGAGPHRLVTDLRALAALSRR